MCGCVCKLHWQFFLSFFLYLIIFVEYAINKNKTKLNMLLRVFSIHHHDKIHMNLFVFNFVFIVNILLLKLNSLKLVFSFVGSHCLHCRNLFSFMKNINIVLIFSMNFESFFSHLHTSPLHKISILIDSCLEKNCFKFQINVHLMSFMHSILL